MFMICAHFYAATCDHNWSNDFVDDRFFRLNAKKSEKFVENFFSFSLFFNETKQILRN